MAAERPYDAMVIGAGQEGEPLSMVFARAEVTSPIDGLKRVPSLGSTSNMELHAIRTRANPIARSPPS